MKWIKHWSSERDYKYLIQKSPALVAKLKLKPVDHISEFQQEE